jgi:phosphoglycerate kinase
MNILRLKDLPIENKRVLLRVDFNVPLDKSFLISDDSRIVAALPTIEYIIGQGASLVIISHLGRPKGEYNPQFSLKTCADRLSEMLKRPVLMAPDCIGNAVKKMKSDLKPKEILVLENVRFHKEETAKERDLAFAEDLASECDFYVDDAFGCCHRSQASIVDLPQLFLGKSAMGFLLEKEIKYFNDHILNPNRPFVAIIGGAKISTKIGVIESLSEKVDALLIGGAMAYTFLKAKGFNLGKSLVEDSYIEVAKSIIDKCKTKNIPLLLPKDLVFTEEFKEGAKKVILNVGDPVPSNLEGVDIGPITIELFKSKLSSAKTVLWNGPLGVFEIKDFARGTQMVAEILSETGATTIIGGGDSASAVKQLGLEDKFDHISTGGGASLEFIEKGHLPGIDVLSKK